MTQIVLTDKDWAELTQHLTSRSDVESGAYAIFKTSMSKNHQKILVTQTMIPRTKDYYKRTATSVAFKPEFTEKAFQICEATKGHLLDIHTHPWASVVNFSHIDDREAINTKVPYLLKYLPETMIAFIVLGRSPLIAKARFWDKSLNFLSSIDRIVVI